MSRPWGDVIEVKTNFVPRLKKDLEKSSHGVFGLGTVTDPYQPVEEEYELTRGSLALLKQFGARVSILTKSDLVIRDIDLLKGWPEVEVGISVGSADECISSVVEPHAPSPARRFSALRRLNDDQVDTYLMAAPIIGGLSDSCEMLISLVREADMAGVKRIMWDKFNPKPLATSRLRRKVAEIVKPPSTASDAEAVLRRECEIHGIELVRAF